MYVERYYRCERSVWIVVTPWKQRHRRDCGRRRRGRREELLQQLLARREETGTAARDRCYDIWLDLSKRASLLGTVIPFQDASLAAKSARIQPLHGDFMPPACDVWSYTALHFKLTIQGPWASVMINLFPWLKTITSEVVN